ncbi:MAG TPA: LirA/MavJ family T4SS effector [Myxococcaceae bacterium]
MLIADEYVRDINILTKTGAGSFKPRPTALQDPVLAAYVKAVYFLLADPQFISDGLTHLDKALVAATGGVNTQSSTESYFKGMEQFHKTGASFTKADDTSPLRGALSKVLLASQQRGGFATDMQVTIAKSTDTASLENIKAFANLQKTAQHFKDINAGADHGEFTHQIQWYMLTEGWALVQEKMVEAYKEANGGTSPGSSLSISTPGDLMTAVGATGTAAVGLWPMLFDRVDASVNGVYVLTTDLTVTIEGRSPEKLHLHMRHMSNTYPTLRAFLRARYAKRGKEQMATSFDYFGKKKGQGAQEINPIGYLGKPSKK